MTTGSEFVPVDVLMPELDGYQVLEHARASRDAAFMSIPEVRDPPVDQLSALRPLCAPACRPAERKKQQRHWSDGRAALQAFQPS